MADEGMLGKRSHDSGNTPSPKRKKTTCTVQNSPVKSQDDQYLYWESSQGSQVSELDSIVLAMKTNISEETVSGSLLSIWEQEHTKREKKRLSLRKVRSSTDYLTQRTRSTPQLTPDSELLSNELNELLQSKIAKKTSPIKHPPQQPRSFLPLISPTAESQESTENPSTQPNSNSEIVQREIDDIMMLMKDGDPFEDDIFLASCAPPIPVPDSIPSQESSLDISEGSDTEETDSDVEVEEEKERKPSPSPFALDRTKTRDFLPLSKEYQPPLRCLVLEISTSLYYGENERSPDLTKDEFDFATPVGSQKVLRVFDENRLLEKIVYLRGQWTDTNVRVGDYVNIVSWSMTHEQLLQRKQVLINNQRNAIILHPDILIPAKAIGSSIQCSRQAVLSQLIKVPSFITEPILKGEIIHELFERALLRNNFSTPFLDKQLEEIIASNLIKIHILKKDVGYFQELTYPSVKQMQQWAQVNLHGAVVSLARSTSMMSLYDRSLVKSIRKILAVEESIWSPLYGLKGKIDATVVYKPNRLANIGNLAISEPVSVPFELKTGRNRTAVGNTADRAQVALYSLLFSERALHHETAKEKFPEGILCYINNESKSQFSVRSSMAEIQSLIQRRNDVASYLNQQQTLPPLVKNERVCNYCNHQKACMLYHKSLERGKSGSSGVPKIFIQHTEHLSASHCRFFVQWDKFIALEAAHSQNSSAGVWNFPSAHQEEQGICAGQMKLTSSRSMNTPQSQSSQKSKNEKPKSLLSSSGFVYRFEKANESRIQRSSKRTYSSAFLPSATPTDKTLDDLQFTVGDFVLLSTEYGHFGVRQGTILRINRFAIDIRLEEMIQAPYYSPSIEPLYNGSQSSQESDISDIEDLVHSRVTQFSESTLWRIDKLESQSIYARMRSNLIRLFDNNSRCQRLRELIIETVPPTFKKIEVPCDEFIQTWSQQYPSIRHLNSHQRNAIKHVLAAQDYALILGMPGTGKTSTIAHIVATLVEQGKKILLTSYTHSAIDNLLLKLKELSISFLRLGKENRIHPAILPYTLQSHATMESLTDKLDQQVIGTTCLGIDDLVLKNIQFDYCIIDEASQINLPVCLGPLFASSVFVLVGDHYQLPPIIKSPEALEAGTYESLFKILSENHPNSVIQLGIQYRMNKEIMSISNELVYNHRLKCGSEEIANSVLQVSWLSRLPSPSSVSDHWLLNIVLAENQVLFVDLDATSATELKKDRIITNRIEARLTALIARSFMMVGVQGSEIGVISPYKSQLQLIRHFISRFQGMNDVDVFTVDKYQGKDKEVIIFSLVRSNAKQKVGELLEDWRRANVAFTRAKKKLIILGSSSTLSGNHFFSLFLRLAEEKSWIFRLPSDAHKTYSLKDFERFKNCS